MVTEGLRELIARVQDAVQRLDVHQMEGTFDGQPFLYVLVRRAQVHTILQQELTALAEAGRQEDRLAYLTRGNEPGNPNDFSVAAQNANDSSRTNPGEASRPQEQEHCENCGAVGLPLTELMCQYCWENEPVEASRLASPPAHTSRVSIPMLRTAAGMLNACAEHLEPLAVGYGASQMRAIANELSALANLGTIGSVMTASALAVSPPETEPAMMQVLEDAAEIRSACGFMWMRMAVVKDVQDAYDVSKREFQDHEAAFKRLETALPTLLAALRAQEEGKALEKTPWTIDGSMPLPVCRNDTIRRADVVTMWNEWRCGLPADKPFRHSDGVAFLTSLNELASADSALRAATAPQQEPDVSLEYVATLNGAKSVVNSSVLYRRFIDGTPLENDIAVWMTDFAMQAVKAHGKHVANFLNELYAVMVDPCAEGSINVKDMKAALIAAAIRDRDKWAATAPQAFTENEIKDVLTALYQDGDVDLVLADRIAALMASSAATAPQEDRIMVDRDAELRRELRAHLDTLTITSENIGDLRRSLFVPWASQWNGWVRDETAAREIPVAAHE